MSAKKKQNAPPVEAKAEIPLEPEIILPQESVPNEQKESEQLSKDDILAAVKLVLEQHNKEIVTIIQTEIAKAKAQAGTVPEMPEIPQTGGQQAPQQGLASLLPMLSQVMGNQTQENPFQQMMVQRAIESMDFKDRMMELMFTSWAKQLGVDTAILARGKPPIQPEQSHNVEGH